MSLNGLDDVKVTEAYQTALAEAGGWLLLKYASRDEVDLYKRGSGGVAEARTAIADYEDKSPLYGYLAYRRRKVLIKYIPDGTSRLLQARVTVHFTSFEEKFTPHDTVFPLTSHIELTETALSQACSLHSAADSGRSSSASAQRKNKLDEIVEDPKERLSYDARLAIQRPPTDKPAIVVAAAVPAAPTTAPPANDLETRPGTRDSQLTDRTPPASKQAAAVPELPYPFLSSEPPTRRPSSPALAGDTVSLYAVSLNSISRPDQYESRASTSTARPSLSDLEFARLYLKPKVKLGPRPSIDASRASSRARPVSTLPPGLRAGPRKDAQNTFRPTSRGSQMSVNLNITIPPPPPIPESPPQMPTFVRPSSSPASVKSMPTTLAGKSEKLSREKKRLMKAMELRKKQMGAAKSQPTTPTEPRMPIVEDAPLPVPTVEAKFDAVSQRQEDSKDSHSKSELQTEEAKTVVSEATDKQSRQAVEERPPAIEDPPSLSEEPQGVSSASASETPEEEATPKIEEPPSELAMPPAPAPEASGKDLEVGDPERASGVHLKADSGIEIQVHRTPQHPRDDQAAPAPSSSPVSLEQSSALPSTRPSSISETGEESTIVEAGAKHASETRPENKQGFESQETITAPSEQTRQTIEPDIEAGQEAEPSPSKAEEEAEEVRAADQSHPQPVEDADGSSDITPTEKSVAAADESHLAVTRPSRSDSLQKRPTVMRSLGVDTQLNLDDSEDDTSDDDFLHELRNAKLQEAKPIRVSQSPITAVFPGIKPTTISAINGSRSSSSPAVPTIVKRRPVQLLRSASDQTVEDSPRSASSPLRVSRFPDQQDSVGVAKKSNVSSGISARIKALARNSTTVEQSPLDRVPSRDGPSIVALRKSSLRDATPPPLPQPSPSPSPSPASTFNSVRNRVSSLSKNPPFHTPEKPLHPLGIDVAKAHDGIQTVYNVQKSGDRRQSMTVTARIVRDPRTEKPDLSMPTQATPLDLHESPLIVEHKSPPSEREVEIPRAQSSPVRTPEPTSFLLTPTSDRDGLSPTSPRRSSLDTWRSTISRHARRGSEVRSPTAMVKTLSSASLDTNASNESKSGDEKGRPKRRSSRSKRVLRRMSNSISLGRKTLAEIVSPTRASAEPALSPAPRSVPPQHTLPQASCATEVGDLNVQLPDTLLWKRRWVEIDTEGYLVVKMSKSNESASTKGLTKRFHLGEFRRPFLPDQERQEMPNSVVLDFLDGRTLQCACETGAGQVEALRLLQTAHQQWSTS